MLYIKVLFTVFNTFALVFVKVAVDPGPILALAFALSGMLELDFDFITGFSGRLPLAFSNMVLTGP